jgi:eukaryotic-like serine/threonine-protein kinase
MEGRLPSIGSSLGRYRLLEQIGHGGMGIVFRAHDEELDRVVAVKIIPAGTFPDENSRKRFRREARVLAKLNHPNVTTVFDYGTEGDIDYLVTEFVGGVALDSRVAAGPLPQKAVLELGIQLAKGLAAAHREQIIHRDLKPANLRLTASGDLKILDFGLASSREPVSDFAKTMSAEMQDHTAGTLPYMAPEQIKGEITDPRTDVWGAGAVLYELSTGQRPFPMISTLKLIDAIQRYDPSPPSTLNKQITPALDAVVLKALDKDPERRYQSAGELGVDLARLLPITESNKLATAELSRSNNRSQWAQWAALATLLAMVLAFVGYRLHGSSAGVHLKQRKLLAVLPFTSTGQDEKTAALIVGLTDTLSAKLGQDEGSNFEVISARDVTEQGVTTSDQAWKDFGSDLVLEGTAHRVGEQVRINCSLVEAKTHRQLAARTITSDVNNVFVLEDRVASEVTSLLSTVGDAGAQPSLDRSARNPEAYASFLRGRGYLSDYQKPENVELAIAELTTSVRLDSKQSDPYAVLGEAYVLGYQQTNRTNDWVILARQNCEKSLNIRETAEGRICLGGVYNVTGNYDLAAQEFQRAVQADPRNDAALRGEAAAYLKLGNPSAAEAAYEKAIAIRSDYWGGYSWLGAFYYQQARYDDAIKEFKKVIELAPANYRGYSNLGAMYVAKGNYAEAIGPLNKSVEIRPNLEALNNLGNAYFQLRRFSDAADAFKRGLNLDDNDWLLWGNLGDALFWNDATRGGANEAYEKAISRGQKKLEVNPKDTTVLAFLADYNAMSGHRQKAIEQIEQAMALAPDDGEVRFRSAIVYNQLGDTEKCLASLQRAAATGYSAQAIRDTPDFDHLHGDPRFRASAHLY